MKNSLFLLATFVAHALFSQSAIKISKGFRSLRQNALFIECMVLEDPVLHKHEFENDKFYHWFQSQHILTTQGGASGQLLHGGYEAFYDSKQLAEKGKFHKGLKHGEWKYWNSNGTLTRIEHWKNGTQLGKTQQFGAAGVVQYTLIYRRTSIRKTSLDSVQILSRTGELKKYKLLSTQNKLINRWIKVTPLEPKVKFIRRKNKLGVKSE